MKMCSYGFFLMCAFDQYMSDVDLCGVCRFSFLKSWCTRLVGVKGNYYQTEICCILCMFHPLFVLKSMNFETVYRGCDLRMDQSGLNGQTDFIFYCFKKKKFHSRKMRLFFTFLYPTKEFRVLHLVPSFLLKAQQPCEVGVTENE